MTPIIQKVLAGVASGFVAAFIVDLQAWAKFPGKPYAWSTAIPRWFSGAVSGGLAALGMGQFADTPVGGASDV